MIARAELEEALFQAEERCSPPSAAAGRCVSAAGAAWQQCGGISAPPGTAPLLGKGSAPLAVSVLWSQRGTLERKAAIITRRAEP